MFKKIAVLAVTIALSGLALPSLAQGEAAGAIGNGGGGEAANVAQVVRQPQARNQVEETLTNGNQLPQQQARIESWQQAEVPQDQIRQGINPGLVGEMRARMRQAGGIGSYQPQWQMAPVTASPDNMDAAYGRPRMFAQLMHQHAVLTQPYRMGGN